MGSVLECVSDNFNQHTHKMKPLLVKYVYCKTVIVKNYTPCSNNIWLLYKIMNDNSKLHTYILARARTRKRNQKERSQLSCNIPYFFYGVV